MKGLAPGKDLDSRFQLVRPLVGAARGERGEVWLVEDRELDELLVAKILPAEARAEEVALLKHECKNARKLVHPGIAPIYEFHRGNGVGFVTMAHVEGVPLDEYRPRSIEQALDILIRIAGALEYAHRRGVVHRDLVASNVVVDASDAPHLLDFGIGGLLAAGATDPSPETSEHHDPVDGRAPVRRGAEASVGDDIYRFGVLAYRLCVGEEYRKGASFPADLPGPIRDLLRRALDPDPTARPKSMEEMRKTLEGSRVEARPPVVTPPPRVRDVTPVAVRSASDVGGIASPMGESARHVSPGGVGAKTVAAFVVVLGAALFVFAVLPRWVSERPRPQPESSPSPSSSSSSFSSGTESSEAMGATPDLAALAREKTLAEQSREKYQRSRDGLAAKNAGMWGGEDYRAALDRGDAGEALFSTRSYTGAAEAFDDAVSRLNAVESRSRDLLKDALDRGRRALTAGSSAEATEQFRFALVLAPESAEARKGLDRAEKLDEVLSLVSSGESHERAGDLSEAAALYRKAIALDRLSETAQRALARVDAQASERAFAAAMTEALSALNREDYPSAKLALDRASAIRPDAPEIQNGRAQIEEGLRAQAISSHRDRASRFEASEDWRDAEKEYDAALALDANLRFALEGKKRSADRALVSEKIDFQLGHSERLSDENALREAALLLAEARGVDAPGPKLAARIGKLAALVDSYATPVRVRLLSDELTDVVVSRVGRLGKFDERTIELRPGRYTVVGSREGYRDVRQELVVESGRETKPLLVRCEEKI